MEILFLSAAAAWATIGAAWDVRSRRVPNFVSYSGLLAGILLRSSLLGWRGLVTALAGGAVGGGIFFLLYLVKGMGAGDVKLMAAVGALVGIPVVFHIMLACALAGGIMALAVTLYRSTAARTFRNVWELLRFHAAHGPQVHPTLNLDNPQTARLPYALAIAAGCGYELLESLLAR
jgi:prepilin peptidase CpaA